VVTPPPPEVSVSQPIEEPVQETSSSTGRIGALDSVEVRARVTGYITKVAFVEGALVNAGDLLFEIDRASTRRPCCAPRGRWPRCARRSRAPTPRSRATRRCGPRAPPARASLERAIAERGAVEGQLKTSQAQLELAKLDLEFTKVTAPITGRASRAEITQGNLVVVGPGGGPLLTTIVSLDPIYVDFDADERALVRLRKATIARDGVATPEAVRAAKLPVSSGLGDETDFSHQGTVDFVDNQVNPSTGTIRVRAVLPNPQASVRARLFVRVRVPVGESAPGSRDDRAIGTDPDRKFVLVGQRQDVVEYRP
jgi:multidrug efflux system membrane fusion protein